MGRLAVTSVLACLASCSVPAPSLTGRLAQDHVRVGSAAYVAGDFAAAREHFELALSAARERDDWRSRVDAETNLGLLDEIQDATDSALTHYDHAAVFAREAGYSSGEMTARCNHVRLLLALDRTESVAAYLGELDALSARIGSYEARASVLKLHALDELKRDHLPEAEHAARDAARLYDLLESDPPSKAALADARYVYGVVLAGCDRELEAIEQLDKAVALAAGVGDVVLQAKATLAIADTLMRLDRKAQPPVPVPDVQDREHESPEPDASLADGRAEDARVWYLKALALYRASRRPQDAALAIEGLRRVADRLGRLDYEREADEAAAER